MAARKKTGKVDASARRGRNRATKGPAALQEAVADGLELLTRSRSSAGRAIRDAFEAAQGSVESRIGSARDQATETWDNLEALFQSRVHKALQQLGVPSGDEIRLLTQRVAELNENVKALAAGRAHGRAGRRPAARPARARARRKVRAG